MEYIYLLPIPAILCILYFLYSRQSTKETPKESTKTIIQTTSNDKYTKQLFASMINYLSRNHKLNQSLVDRLNKKSLFNRDVTSRRIVVDTNSLVKKDSDFQYGNYVYDFTNPSDFLDEFNSIGPIHNVIGIRLTKAIVPTKLYTISHKNDLICVQYGSGTPELIHLTHGIYVSDLLFQCFPNPTTGNELRQNLQISTQFPETNYANKLQFECEQTFTLIYDESTLQTYFSSDQIKRIRNNAKTFGFTVGKTYSSNGVNRQVNVRIGINDNDVGTTDLVYFVNADCPPNLLTDYIDVVINEIPKLGCYINNHDERIVERIPLTNPTGTNYIYQPDLNYEINYFTPITLDRFTIQLYEPQFYKYYNPECADHMLEFELTYVIQDHKAGLISP